MTVPFVPIHLEDMRTFLLRRPLLPVLGSIVFIVAWLAACVPEPVTPVFVLRYPDTWTPAPTPTNTPVPPTATLVIQRTAGPPPTRDPNVRFLPSSPRGGTGTWLDASGMNAEQLTIFAPVVQVLSASALPTAGRSSNAYLLLRADAGDPAAPAWTEPLDPRWGGMLVTHVTSDNVAVVAQQRDQIAPRLMLMEAELPLKGAVAELASQLDGICYCNFLREPEAGLGQFKSESEWLDELQTLATLSARPDQVVLTATRFDLAGTADSNALRGWFQYALATYLLAVNGQHSFFSFQGESAPEWLADPALRVRLGTPFGAASRANGVYQRRFSDGLVLVNPGAEARTVSLSRAYRTVAGNPVGAVRMPPHSGMILTSVE